MEPTVTITLSQFLIMKRALRDAWVYKQEQMNILKNQSPANFYAELESSYKKYRHLEYELSQY